MHRETGPANPVALSLFFQSLLQSLFYLPCPFLRKYGLTPRCHECQERSATTCMLQASAVVLFSFYSLINELIILFIALTPL